MSYQFGTRRLQKNPLKELIELEDNARLKEQNEAYRLMRQFPFRDVYIKNGEYFERVTDNNGRIQHEPLDVAGYNRAIETNKIYNDASQKVGLAPIETSPYVEPEKKTNKMVAKAKQVASNLKNLVTGGDKSKSVKVQDVGDAGRDVLQPTNNNVAGLNADVTKPVGGGAVKQSLFDDKIGKQSIVNPNDPTEIAYNRSLNRPKYEGTPETEKAYRESKKGKPPPNLTEKELANIGKRGIASRKRERNRQELQNIIDIQKGDKKNFFTRDMGSSAKEMDSANREAPRLALPSMAGANQKAEDALVALQKQRQKEAMDKSFLASAKRTNREALNALRAYEDSIAPTSPNTESLVYRQRSQPQVPAPDIVEKYNYASPSRKLTTAGRNKLRINERDIVSRKGLKSARDKVLSQFARDLKEQYDKISKGTITPRDYKKFGSFK